MREGPHWPRKSRPFQDLPHITARPAVFPDVVRRRHGASGSRRASQKREHDPEPCVAGAFGIVREDVDGPPADAMDRPQNTPNDMSGADVRQDDAAYASACCIFASLPSFAILPTCLRGLQGASARGAQRLRVTRARDVAPQTSAGHGIAARVLVACFFLERLIMAANRRNAVGGVCGEPLFGNISVAATPSIGYLG
jgi:hypothetical protein